MKTQTREKRAKIANDIMFYIYTHIDTNINIEELADSLKVSKFHMHRVFKEEFGKNIHESIKSIRLQKASNLLITNKDSTISRIALACGYGSQTAFLKVFKERFTMTPKEWKRGGHRDYAQALLERSPIFNDERSVDFETLEPVIVKMPDIQSYYIRHQGYDLGIKRTWQKLYAWILGNNFQNYTEIALYHDNPTITPLMECQYIACVATTEAVVSKNRLPQFSISGGVYARFDVSGIYGDVMLLLHWIYHEWLPASGFETSVKPSFAVYHKNHFLSEDGAFSLSLYVPVRY